MIESDFTALQLPRPSFHFTKTVLGPLLDDTVTCCSGQYGRSTHVAPSVESAIAVTPLMSVAGISITGSRVAVNAEPFSIVIVPVGGVSSSGRSIPYQMDADNVSDQLPASSRYLA